MGVNTTNYEHTYAGKRHLGNIDVTNQQQPVNGKVWRWECGASVGEKLWPLPLPVEYEETLLSTVAKIKNVGGPYAGASTAGLFLQRFIGKGVSWAHLDIAGTSDYDKKQRYFLQAGATGAMVRTLTDFIGRM